MTNRQKRRIIRAVKLEFQRVRKLTERGRHYNSGLRIRLVLKHFYFIRCDYLRDIQSCSDYWVWNHCKCKKRMDCAGCFLISNFGRSMWAKEGKEMISVVKDRLERVAMIMSKHCRWNGFEGYDCCYGLQKCPFEANCIDVSYDMWIRYLTEGGDYKIKLDKYEREKEENNVG